MGRLGRVLGASRAAFPSAFPPLFLRFPSAFVRLRPQLGATPPDKSTPEVAHKRFPESTKFRPNIDPKRHQKNDRVWDRFFWPSWLHFGNQLGTMLAPFSPKVGRCCGVLPSSLLRCLFYPTFSRFVPAFTPSWLDFGASGPHLGGLLAPFLLFLVPSWRPLGALGRKNGPGYNEIFLPGPAECAKRLNPPAHLWWCDGRVKQSLVGFSPFLL